MFAKPLERIISKIRGPEHFVIPLAKIGQDCGQKASTLKLLLEGKDSDTDMIPATFIITPEVCKMFDETGHLPAGFEAELHRALSALERATGEKFYVAGQSPSFPPLLLAVRASLDDVALPHMPPSVLGAGLTNQALRWLEDETVPHASAVARHTLCDFVTTYGATAHGMGKSRFKDTCAKLDASPDEVLHATQAATSLLQTFEQDGFVQLMSTILAMYRAYLGDRVQRYRSIEGLPRHGGLAIILQPLVVPLFSGVCMSRNVRNGAKDIMGRFFTAETPRFKDIAELPLLHAEQLKSAVESTEKTFGFAVDVSWIFALRHDGKERLFITSVRGADSTAQASLVIASSMVTENLVTPRQALLSMKPSVLEGSTVVSNSHTERVMGWLDLFARMETLCMCSNGATAHEALGSGAHGLCIDMTSVIGDHTPCNGHLTTAHSRDLEKVIHTNLIGLLRAGEGAHLFFVLAKDPPGVASGEMLKVQLRAIFGALHESRYGAQALTPVLVSPPAFGSQEIEEFATLCTATAAEKWNGSDAAEASFAIAAMIATPRACIRAAGIAAVNGIGTVFIDTDELTSLMYGVDSFEPVLESYFAGNVLSRDPERELDPRGVAPLVRYAAEMARSTRPDVRIFIRGRHVTRLSSAVVAEHLTADALVCLHPAAITATRLSAAQASIRLKRRRRDHVHWAPDVDLHITPFSF